MSGRKIAQFSKSKDLMADSQSEDFDKLVIELEEFNKTWIITKHGMLPGGLKELSFHKDGQFHTFDQ
jgi:hypothetical protein